MLASRCVLYCLILMFIFCMVTGHHNHRHKSHNSHHHNYEQDSLISTKELRKISEEIFDMLPNQLYQSLFINYQEKRESKDAKDEAPDPLLIISSDLFETTPTIHQMRKLYDNYDINSLHSEDITAKENLEEDNFIDELLTTDIMIRSMDFLSSKGYFKKDLDEYKNVLKTIWFHPYSRTNRTALGSSGFEHVFLVEKKKGSYITGLHNWIFFATEEYENKANYLGYIHKVELANKAAVVKFYLSYLEKVKLSTMFIGTPPEFDIALYTICFYARPNRGCRITLGNVKITIQTWVQYSNNEQLVASSFPMI